MMPAILCSDDKHEIVTVDTGYKVYMKLHIRNIERSDIAEYRCVAKNSLGHSDGSISLYGNNHSNNLKYVTLILFRGGASNTTNNIHLDDNNYNRNYSFRSQ